MAAISEIRRNNLVQRLLQFDGAVEIALCVGLLAYADTLGDWVGLSSSLIGGIGIFAFAYAAFLFYSARGEISRRLAWVVAFLNVDSAILLGVGVVLAWNDLPTDAKWTLGIAADAALLLGLAQLWALWRSR